MKNSYFPSNLRLWNELDQDTRNSSSVLEFKNRKSQVTDKPTNYMIPRERANEISLTRIKHNCSSLNADLNRVNIVPVPFAAVEQQTKQPNIIFSTVTYLLFLETVY